MIWENSITKCFYMFLLYFVYNELIMKGKIYFDLYYKRCWALNLYISDIIYELDWSASSMSYSTPAFILY